MTVKFVGFRVPLVDPGTGVITREWYRLFEQLFNVPGGISDDFIDLVGPSFGVGTDEISAGFASSLDGISQLPPSSPIFVQLDDALSQLPPVTQVFVSLDDVAPVLNGLRDEIAALRNAVDDLRKGTVTL